MRLLNGKHLNRKVEIEYPIQLDKKISRDIQNTLSHYGVHASYEALETQALYEGSMFIQENKTTYEFLFLRNIYSFLTVSSLLLVYLLDTKQFLKVENPDAINIVKDMAVQNKKIAGRLEEMSKSSSGEQAH